MKWLWVMFGLPLCLMMALWPWRDVAAPLPQPQATGLVYQIKTDAATRFTSVELWIDSGDQPLAAYQLEFQPALGSVKIVGIEGGAHPEFADPPYYDPRAMMSERVILADFSTAAPAALPKGRTRLATIHLHGEGEVMPQFLLRLDTAAGPDGSPIQADIQIISKEGQT